MQASMKMTLLPRRARLKVIPRLSLKVTSLVDSPLRLQGQVPCPAGADLPEDATLTAPGPCTLPQGLNPADQGQDLKPAPARLNAADQGQDLKPAPARLNTAGQVCAADEELAGDTLQCGSASRGGSPCVPALACSLTRHASTLGVAPQSALEACQQAAAAPHAPPAAPAAAHLPATPPQGQAPPRPRAAETPSPPRRPPRAPASDTGSGACMWEGVEGGEGARRSLGEYGGVPLPGGAPLHGGAPRAPWQATAEGCGLWAGGAPGAPSAAANSSPGCSWGEHESEHGGALAAARSGLQALAARLRRHARRAAAARSACAEAGERLAAQGARDAAAAAAAAAAAGQQTAGLAADAAVGMAADAAVGMAGMAVGMAGGAAGLPGGAADAGRGVELEVVSREVSILEEGEGGLRGGVGGGGLGGGTGVLASASRV